MDRGAGDAAISAGVKPVALYAIGDTHLSLGIEQAHGRVRRGLGGLRGQAGRKGCLCRCGRKIRWCSAGDISWGMSLEEAEADFAWLWMPCLGEKASTEGKPRLLVEHGGEDDPFFCRKAGFPPCTSSTTTATSMGTWPSAAPGVGSMRRRSRGRMKRCFAGSWPGWRPRSRPPGPGRSSAFFITPLFTRGTAAPPSWSCWERYQVRACYYGHLHGASHRLALQGRRGGVEYRLVSADYLKFRPEKILE